MAQTHAALVERLTDMLGPDTDFDEYTFSIKCGNLRNLLSAASERLRTPSDELTHARAEIARKDEALRRVLEWWPEGSETGRQDKGGSFEDDIRSARAALEDTTP